MHVFAVMDGAARYSQALAGADFVRLAVDPPRQRPRQAVDDFVDLAVIVRNGDAGVGCTVISKITRSPEPCLIHQKTQLQPTDPNDVGDSTFHDSSLIVK